MPNVTIPASDGSELKAYLAPCPRSGAHPGVVVIQDAFGLTKVTRDHCDRLASYCYIAVAPDLYSRGGMVRCVKATFRSLSTGEGQAFADIEATRAWIGEREDCSGRLGIIGFCMGGGFALMAANRNFAVSAPNYGQLPKDLGAALDGACPIVASYGARDRMLKRVAAKLESALQERGIPHDVKEYPEAGHSFLDRFPLGPAGPALQKVTGMGYHAPSAEDAWARIRSFFDLYLAGT